MAEIQRFNRVTQMRNHDTPTYDQGHVEGIIEFLIRPASIDTL